MSDKKIVTMSDGTEYIVTGKGQYLKSVDKRGKMQSFFPRKQRIYKVHS